MSNRRIFPILMALTIIICTAVRTPNTVFAEDPRQKSIAMVSAEEENTSTEIEDTSTEEELTMYQFRYNDEVVTYNEKIPKSLYPYEISAIYMKQENQPLHVITNKEGNIRCVYINESGIETYHGIEVGFSENRIFATYDSVHDVGDGQEFYVYFDEKDNIYTYEQINEQEIPEDSIMCYGYKTENHIITQIYLFDYTYAMTGK